MLRLLALVLPLLPPPVCSPEPSAQDVRLGVVSARVPRRRPGEAAGSFGCPKCLRTGSGHRDSWTRQIWGPDLRIWKGAGMGRWGPGLLGPEETRGWRAGTLRGAAGGHSGLGGPGCLARGGDATSPTVVGGERPIPPTLPTSPVRSFGLGLADPLRLPAAAPPRPSPAAEPCKAAGCDQGHAEVCWAA